MVYGGVRWCLTVTLPAVLLRRLVSRMADKSLTLEKSPFRPAAIAHPQNLSSLKKSRTDAEFQAAYDVVLEIVEPFSDLSREEQLEGSAVALRRMVDRWKVTCLLYTSDAADE